MQRILSICLSITILSCGSVKKMHWPTNSSGLAGSAFYEMNAAAKWSTRDSVAVKEINNGNVPDFLRKFVAVHVEHKDSLTNKIIKATYYVAPDYLSIGNDHDWARINITPYAAQQIADTFGCFLPTRKMVDDIYKAAKLKLAPVPMYAFRDSTPTMWQHHLIIEGQRKGKRGLIAGIKKDIIISGKLLHDAKPDRVAIYGWHQLNGQPIQPLYTGHIYWWVDYSQGVRLVYRKIKVNGKWMDYTDVLKDASLSRLLCDEGFCDCYRYPGKASGE